MFFPNHPDLRDLAKQLLDRGYVILCSPDPQWQSYFHVSDGTRIGYVQDDRLAGITCGTVTKPSREYGTGSRVYGGRDLLHQVERAMDGHHGIQGIGLGARYRDLDEFLAYKASQRQQPICVFHSDLA